MILLHVLETHVVGIIFPCIYQPSNKVGQKHLSNSMGMT